MRPLRALKKRPLVSALGCAVLVRVLVALWVCSTPPVINLSNGYIENAATLVSGKGLLMPAGDTDNYDILRLLKSREQMGRKVGVEDSFPSNTRQWVPATLHPPGYALLLALFYKLGNVTGMLWGVLYFQIILDALTCALVFVFVRNVFGADAAFVAAWIYALLPAPILLSMQILPDGLACFLAGSILASASYIPTRGLRAALATGVIIGMGCLFRAEFVLWSAIIVGLILFACPARTGRKLWWSAALALSYIAVLIPWTVWTYHATGHPILTSTAGGGAMYLSLGEIPNNPWRITPEDGWVSHDAVARGLNSAWTPEGDAYYKRLFFASIRSHPGAFARLLITQRLPLALAPGYYLGGDMWFTEHRLNENLTRWQILWKYPAATLRHEWLKFVECFLSVLLLAAMLYSCFFYRHALRWLAWIWAPWIVTTVSISLIHQIDARLLASNLIPQVAAAALVLSRHVSGASEPSTVQGSESEIRSLQFNRSGAGATAS